jgi:hypothetical protein
MRVRVADGCLSLPSLSLLPSGVSATHTPCRSMEPSLLPSPAEGVAGCPPLPRVSLAALPCRGCRRLPSPAEGVARCPPLPPLQRVSPSDCIVLQRDRGTSASSPPLQFHPLGARAPPLARNGVAWEHGGCVWMRPGGRMGPVFGCGLVASTRARPSRVMAFACGAC